MNIDLKNKENVEKWKKELIDRYCYLYENAPFILASFVYIETSQEMDKRKKLTEKYKLSFNNSPLIYLKDLDYNSLSLLEEMLLGDKNLIDTDGYKKIENLKNNKTYLEKIRMGFNLQEQKNKEIFIEAFKIDLSIWTLLKQIRFYIINQSSDLINKELKLGTIDEYFRIYRYSNDGKIWTSGYELNLTDITNNLISYSYISNSDNSKPNRDQNDIGVINNPFINCFANNLKISKESNTIHLSEQEKQEIYLKFHDVLPWNLEIACISDNIIEKPDHTESCKEIFNIKEEEIFISYIVINEETYIKYWQLCPKCGYIVNIPEKLLSEVIKRRIVERCNNDIYLFKKMSLLSELKALGNYSNERQNKLVKE